MLFLAAGKVFKRSLISQDFELVTLIVKSVNKITTTSY
jgi:hypothetical protein